MLVTDDGGNVAILVNLSDICAVGYENFTVNSNGNAYTKKNCCLESNNKKSRLNCIPIFMMLTLLLI